MESIERRVWIKSGIVEDFDQRQLLLLNLVHDKIRYYYEHLYQSKPRYRYPLSLSRLCKLCKRSGSAVALAVRILGNTVVYGEDTPAIRYDRVQARKNPSHRPYRIFLRDKV